MGQCFSQRDNQVDPILQTKSKQVEAYLKDEAKKNKQKVKLLVLGAGGGGKSTFLSQIRCIYGTGLNEYSLDSISRALKQNVIDASGALLQTFCSPEYLSTIGSDAPKPFKLSEKVQLEVPESFQTLLHDLSREYLLIPRSGEGAIIKDNSSFVRELDKLLSAPFYAEQIEPRLEGLSVPDCTRYYFENAGRFFSSGYTPTTEDLFRMRIKTSGVVEYTFNYQKNIFNLVDVGGQRSERSKWIHCFQDVSCVLFFVSLAEYDARLEEDSTANRMMESLTLFEELVNSRWFSNLPIALFLNKRDIFVKKIQFSPLEKTFPDYPPKSTPEEAMDFILRKFEKRMGNPANLSAHFTCATDTDNIRNVFNTVGNAVLSVALQNAMF